MATPSELRTQIIRREDGFKESRAELADIINRVGRKLRSLRDAHGMNGAEFVEFRQNLYAMPEDDREAAIDAKIRELSGGE